MKQQDPISDLFRRNQYKLNEQPPLHSWHNIEQKLDQKNRHVFYLPSVIRYFAPLAAAIALVLFMVSVVDVNSWSVSNDRAMTLSVDITTFGNRGGLTDEQLFREKHIDQLKNTIDEGSPDRLLTANKAIRPFLMPRRS